ncbi:hypothetical protein BJY04DRAFT_203984 [Aspergillus karnatakaensis]|uniref:uncharacterized protein n=1 Tax=Aspergillus karnatakaensis TaxID=1810916 RepID=UPI003CCE1C2C
MPPTRRSKRPATVKGSGRANDTQLQSSKTKPHLLHLPREILCRIASSLPAESATCLTLTCHAALSILGTSSWANFIRPTRRYYGGINPLFDLLQHDLPGYFTCSTCNILHPPLKPPATHRRTRLTRNCFYEDPVIDFWPRDDATGSGYSLVYNHISQALQAHETIRRRCTCMGIGCSGHRPLPTTDPVALFQGDFTFVPPGSSVRYRLVSGASWPNNNLVISQQHCLKSAIASVPLNATMVRDLPFRICAHLSTSTEPPPDVVQGRSRYRANGALLTDAVTMAFPDSLRGDSPDADIFRRPTGFEIEQCRDAERSIGQSGDVKKGYIWRCSACPTKFRVEYIPEDKESAEGAECIVTAWHFFGQTYDAHKFWKLFAPRVGPDLPPRMRNCEYWVTERVKERGFPDFEVDNNPDDDL